jgi:hypothetical protein
MPSIVKVFNVQDFKPLGIACISEQPMNQKKQPK